MRESLLLLLCADHLHVQHMKNGKMVEQLEFSDAQEEREAFAVFLRQVNCPTYLLTDLIEEDFRHEIIPHLFGHNRSALLARKFEQFYRGTPFHQATLLQRQRAGRRDDDMLFSALTNPALITPWLDILLANKTPLAGIYSVPQISAPLVKDHPANHLLLISWEKYAGLRQTYFSNHQLQISRLTTIHADMTFQDAVAHELGRTYQYLKNLSLLPSGQTLDVRLLANSHDLLELQLTLPRSADMRYDYVDLATIGQKLGIEHRFTDSDATQVFLHQLAKTPPKTSYANAEHVHYHTLWQMRRALNWGSGALLAGSLLWSVANLWGGSGDSREADELRAQAQRLQSEAAQIVSAFPHTHAPASDMKAGVLAIQQLEQRTIVPDEVLQPVSAVLDRHAQIELAELDWRVDANEPVATNTRADVPARIITLKGSLSGFGTDYRAALDYFDHFQRDLLAQGYQVSVVNKPLDVSSGGSIADRREADTDAPAFALRLSWRPPA